MYLRDAVASVGAVVIVLIIYVSIVVTLLWVFDRLDEELPGASRLLLAMLMAVLLPSFFLFMHNKGRNSD